MAPLSPQTVGTICALYMNGWNGREVARFMEMNYSTVACAIRDAEALPQRYIEQSYGGFFHDTFLKRIEARATAIVSHGIDRVEWRGRIGGTPRLSHKEYILLEKLYVKKRLTIQEISKITGVARTTLYARLRRAGIPRRTRSEGISLQRARLMSAKRRRAIAQKAARARGDEVLTPKQRREACRLYVDEHLTLLEVADRMGLKGKRSRKTQAVRMALVYEGVPRRNPHEVSKLIWESQRSGLQLKEAA